MEFLEKIFDALHFTVEQKEKARLDFDVLLRAKTVKHLTDGLPENQREELAESSQSDSQEKIVEIIKKFYTAEAVQEATRGNLKNIILEYVEFLLQNVDDEEKQAIAQVLVESENNQTL